MNRTIITRAKASTLGPTQVHSSSTTTTNRQPFQESYHNIQRNYSEGERMPKKRPSSPSFSTTDVLSKKIRSKQIADPNSSLVSSSSSAKTQLNESASSKRPNSVGENHSPRKRVCSEASPADMPRLDLAALARKESSRSTPAKLPSIFTPLPRNRAVSSPPRINPDYQHLYQDFVVPLNDTEDKPNNFVRPTPPTPPRTVNPFAVGRPDKEEQESDGVDRPSGDTFGPAVAPLATLLTQENGKQGPESTNPPSTSQSSSALAVPADDASPAPTPFKKSHFFKKPSQIPRLAMPPPPTPKPKTPSTSSDKLLKSTGKPSAISSSKSTLLGFTSKFKQPHASSSLNKGLRTSNAPAVSQASKPVARRTTLSSEAQTSLANLSSAIEKLSIPRPRSSLGHAAGSFRSSLSGRSIQDDLPPRPSSVMEQKRYSVSSLDRPDSRAEERLSKGSRSYSSLSSRLSTGSSLSGRMGSKPSRPSSSTKELEEETPTDTKGKGKEVDSVSVPEVEEEPPESECLKDCVIFVDVRTDDGEDASFMFIQMLKKLSARIINRPGTTATHIVWKSGLQSTLTKYSSMQDPKPLMVGIGWVVQCVERKQRVVESKYLVDLKEAEIIFGGKRRRSMHVKDRSALTEGLIPARKPLPIARSNSNPLMGKPSAALNRTKPLNRFGPRQTKLTFAPKVVPPTPVREEPEPPEVEETREPVDPVIVEQPDSEDVEMEERKNEEWAAQELARQTGNTAKAPSAAVAKAAPLSSSSSSSGSSTSTKVSATTKQKSKKAKGFADLLAQAQNALLEEAKASQQEAVKRARRRSLLFAPKVSSPLKKTIAIPDDGNESD
ncbi:hypothetical protein FRC03_009853 [Tulasnella sp. 419]|nr:hypothetical protein FRC03_009853 [Tulasnella sp. 419]